MPNLLRLPVDNPDDVLRTNEYGANAVIRVEKSSTGGGTGFTEVGTVPIVTGITVYPFDHTAGVVGDWYRTRYSNSGNSVQSAYSTEFQGGVQTTYCSLGDVKLRLFPSPTANVDTQDDEQLLDFIRYATAYIDRVTDRTFLPDPPSGAKTYTFDGFDALERGYALFIPRGIQSVTTLQVAAYTGGSYVTIPLTDYFLQPSPQERLPSEPATELWMTDIPSAGNALPYFGRGYQTVKVTGVFGWAAVPSEIENVCINLVVSMYRVKGAGGGQVTIGGDGSRTYDRLLAWEDKEVLLKYRRKVIVII